MIKIQWRSCNNLVWWKINAIFNAIKKFCQILLKRMNSIRKNMNYSPSILPCHTNVLHNQVWLCSGLILRLHSKLFSSQKLVILSLSLTSNLEASIFTNRKSSQQPKDISTLAFLPFSSSILLKGMYIGRFGILLFDYARHYPHLLVFENENLVLAHKKLEEPFLGQTIL